MSAKQYTLQKDNAVKIVESEVKRAHWLSLGFVDVTEEAQEKKSGKGNKGGSDEPPTQ